MERLSLIDFAPELSLIVVGSQGCAAVALVRVVRNVVTQQYQMIPHKLLPPHPIQWPIVGLSLTKHAIVDNSMTVEVASQSMCFYRLYLLFQNSHLFCYELRKSGSESSCLDVLEQFVM